MRESWKKPDNAYFLFTGSRYNGRKSAIFMVPFQKLHQTVTLFWHTATMAENNKHPLSPQVKAAAAGAMSGFLPRVGVGDTANEFVRGMKYTNEGLKLFGHTETIPSIIKATENVAEKSPYFEFAGAISAPLALGAGLVDMATARPGREKEIAVGSDLPGTFVASYATGAGLAALAEGGTLVTAATAAAAAAPALLVAGGTGFVIKDAMLTNSLHDHQADMNRLVANDSASHLRQAAEKLDTSRQAEGKAGLVRNSDPDKTIDLGNAGNQRLLTESLSEQRLTAEQELAKSQSGIMQMGVLPEGLKNTRKELDSFERARVLGEINVSISELNTLKTRTTQDLPPGTAPDKLAKDLARVNAELARGVSNVEPLIFTYGWKDGKPDGGPQSQNPEVPPEVLKMYERTRKPVPKLIYAADGVTPQTLVVYNIVDPEQKTTPEALKSPLPGGKRPEASKSAHL